MVKILSYFDEWLTSFISFHRNLEMPYFWIIPLLEICLLIIIVYYLSHFIPRGEHK